MNNYKNQLLRRRSENENITPHDLATLLVLTDLTWGELSEAEKKSIKENTELSELSTLYESPPTDSSKAEAVADTIVSGFWTMCEQLAIKQEAENDWKQKTDAEKRFLTSMIFVENYGSQPHYLRRKIILHLKNYAK